MKKTKKSNDIKTDCLTRSEAATAFNVSLVTIDNWRRNGAPTVQAGDGKTELLGPLPQLEIWHILYEKKNEDPDFREMINGKLQDVVEGFCHVHANVFAWIILRNHPRKKEIKNCLAQISKLAAEIEFELA